MKPLSYQFFIFNNEFSHLSVNDDDILSFLRCFESFLPQRNQGIEFEVKDNKITQKVIDSIDLQSIDNKWKIEFKPKQILISYNHSYPDDTYSLDKFNCEALKLIDKISERISFDNTIRLGFIRNIAEENCQDFIEEKSSFINNEIDSNELIEKSIRFTFRKNSSNLEELLNHVKAINYSSDAKIESIESGLASEFSGIHVLDDINTLTSNLVPRFGREKIRLSDINTDIHISTSSNIPIEILNNRNFEKELVSEFQDKFINFMMFDEINEDYSVSIELELLNYFNKNSYVTGQWFSNLFRDFISEPRVLINLLKIIAKLGHKKIPNAHVCVMSLLANKDVEIKDFAIRVFESWADPESLKILDNTVVTPEWLESYRKLVVKDLKTCFTN